MEKNELNRVFDQVKLSPEREEAMLADLLRKETEERSMRKNRKLTAVLAVAAAMALALCAFAIAAAVEPELLSYLGAEDGDEVLLCESAVPLGLEKTSCGSTLRLRQVLADRCGINILMDLTAPEGTVLDGDFYKLESSWDVIAADGTEIDSAWGFGWVVMEDGDPADNKVTLLMTLTPTSYDRNVLGASVKIRFENLYRDNPCRQLVLEGHWDFRFSLSETDSGIQYPLALPLTIGNHTVQLTSLYLSPISVVLDLTEGEESLQEVKEALWADKEKGITLLTDDGERIKMQEGEYSLHLSYVSQRYDKETGRLNFRPDGIIDPTEIQAVEVFGQTVQLPQEK